MRILVVEDEPKMAALLRRGFEEDGYAVDVASDGDDAIWLGTENDYDAVVLDVMLGATDGFDVCRRLRKSERWAPIVMLTARDAIEDRVAGLDAGADDYLTKPFAFAELLARVRALMRRGRPARPAVLRVGDVSLDPASKVVMRNGATISLTPKEYALLEFFMRHPGVALSRRRLIEHVWDFAFEGDPHVVNVYVGYLRDKIGRTRLETVRGVGYRLRAT